MNSFFCFFFKVEAIIDFYFEILFSLSKDQMTRNFIGRFDVICSSGQKLKMAAVAAILKIYFELLLLDKRPTDSESESDFFLSSPTDSFWGYSMASIRPCQVCELSQKPSIKIKSV